MRLLHDIEVAGKKLVAKVDAKNKLLCDNYREEETQANEDDEKGEDDSALAAITKIISEHQEEIDNFDVIQTGRAKIASIVAFWTCAHERTKFVFLFLCECRATTSERETNAENCAD